MDKNTKLCKLKYLFYKIYSSVLMDPDFFVIPNQIYQDLSYLKSLNQVTLEYLVSDSSALHETNQVC